MRDPWKEGKKTRIATYFFGVSLGTKDASKVPLWQDNAEVSRLGS